MSPKRTLLLVTIIGTLVSVVGSVPGASHAAHGQLDATSPAIAPATSHLSDEVQISTFSTPTEAQPYGPAVAHSTVHKQYLVVWHNKRSGESWHIYGQRVSESGQRVGSWFPITSGTGNRVQPALAYNWIEDEYLVVWMYDVSGNGSRWDIRGRTVAWDGSSMGAEIHIGVWPAPWDMRLPSVAWNSYRNEYMVIWDSWSTVTHLAISIGQRMVPGDGSALPNGREIITANTPHQSDIAYNVATDKYLVVWRRMATSVYGDIYGARLKPDGTLDSAEFPINATSSRYQRHPAVTTNQQDRYMVVWQQTYNAVAPWDWDIHGQELDVNGNKVGLAFYVAWALDDDERFPDVACNGSTGEYLAVWQLTKAGQEAIWGRRWGTNVTASSFEVSAHAFWDSKKPAVAADIPGYLMVYEGVAIPFAGATQHIYGRMYWPESLYLPTLKRQ